MSQTEGGKSSKRVLFIVVGLVLLCGCSSLATVIVAAVAMVGSNLESTYSEVSSAIEGEMSEERKEAMEAQAEEAAQEAAEALKEAGGAEDAPAEPADDAE